MNRTHIDLFSGIGGFALACRWAGVETIGFAEIDQYASRVLAKNFPGVTNYGDVRNVPAGAAWLVTGGFPCQPFSVAGKQRGASDDRWLWPEMAGVIDRIRPRWILGENVSGIIRMELDTVLSDLERLDYTAWPIVIPAVGVDAPHRRERVWIVAYADEGDSGRRSIQPQREAQGRAVANGHSENVADADGAGLEGRRKYRKYAAQWIVGQGGESDAAIWQPEPGMGKRIDGIPTRLDGVGGLNGQTTENGTGTLLSALRMPTDTQILSWQTGGHERIQPTQILQSEVHGGSICQRHAILFGLIETGGTVPWDLLRSVWGYSHGEFASHRRQSSEQLAREYPDLMRQLSHFAPPPCKACWSDGSWEGNLPRIATGIKNRVDRLRGLGNAIVPQVAYQLIRMMIEAENEHPTD